MSSTVDQSLSVEDILKLQEEVKEYKLKYCLRNDEIVDLQQQVRKCLKKISTLELENESSRRLTDRANQENDQLLEKFDSVSRAARILQDNEITLKEELKLLREENENLKLSVHDSNVARDNVIEKLKEVSLETRQLIDNCEKSTEESKIFEIKSNDLEQELSKLRRSNEKVEKECKRLQSEVHRKDVEINSLLEKVSSLSNEMVVEDDIVKFLKTEIPKANDNLRKIETQLKKLIDRLNENESVERELKEEVYILKRDNVILREQSTVKDNIIIKQNQDFVSVKTTVDEYHSEILRLDSELKNCHKRVSALNENLEMINSENIDLGEYALFKRSLQKFDSLENIENLLSKLQVLQEIEKFFEVKLSPHVDPSVRDRDDSNPIVTNSKENTISKIKNYLEKALVTIEKLNDKMLRLKNEYEIKLRAKNAEISTLRDLMLSATMYNRILERSLQQFRDNVQLDNTIENKTNELLSVNATLMDSFEELKQVYQTNDRCNGFLFAKIKQLKFLAKILELSIKKKTKSANISESDFDGLFFCINEIFEEIDANEFHHKLSHGSETLMNICEKKVTTNHYLKNMVENMSLEVKRLTSKVELEMTEKIQEIELLKNEMDSVRTDNCDLVNKIKNCNREIVSLSTDNYDLNEKLQNLLKIEQLCESLNQELDQLKNKSSNSNKHGNRESDLAKKMNTLYKLCECLKEENNSLKTIANKFFSDFNDVVINIDKIGVDQLPSHPDFCVLLENVNNLRQEQKALRKHTYDMKRQIQNDILLVKTENNKTCRSMRENLLKLHISCKELREQNESIKFFDFKNRLDHTVSATKLDFEKKFATINANYEMLVADFDEAVKNHNSCKDTILIYGSRMKSNMDKIKALNTSLHLFIQELPSEFSKIILPSINEMKCAISSIVENLKTSYASSNEEIIKEMQEMNSELKKRGSTISSLNQALSDLKKEKHQILEKLQEKENTISEMMEFKKKSEETEREIQTNNRQLEQNYNEELTAKLKFIENLSSEIESLKSQICSKDDIIASLEHEISKQREGDSSSMGTISRTEEVSRLNDVEDSFEERYMKLRCLAVKMKKNIAELNQELKIEKAERAVLQTKLQSVTEQAKGAQILQEECDKLTDEVELRQNEIKELKRIILESDKENQNLKLLCAELTNNTTSSQAEIAVWKSEKNEMEVKLKNQTVQIEKLSNEKSVEEMIKKERDKEILFLKEKLRQIEDSKKKIQNELEFARLEARKQGALTLEMKDYEKTIFDLTNDIKIKENSIQQITEKLNDSVQQNDSLNKQINQLEEQVQSYALNIKKTDEQILNLNKIITNHENEAESLGQRLKQTVHQLENERTKNESLTLQLSNSSAELKIFSESCRSKERQLNDQVKSLQGKLFESDERFKKYDSEFKKMKYDFEAYKIRAHNALQKCKAENNSKNNEEKLQTEINSLSSTLKTLRKQLDDTLNETDNQKVEISLLKTTKENLSSKVKELSEIVNAKSKEIDTGHAEFKAYKLNAETLISCYKVEIEKLKSLNEELKNKNVEVQNAELLKKNENVRCIKNVTVGDFGEPDFSSDNRSRHNSSCDLPESEIEAIEETERYRKSSKHSLIPLDRLLERDINESRRFDLSEAELRENVENLEQQVKYLTSILNESEKNSARSEEQVTFLKDEIRRLQRMFEREPHLQNTEYVKNVLLKFITLPCGEEKYSLITVLETILKLTPNEKQTLSAAAKGYRLDSKQPGGWTSFLGWT